MKTVFFVLQATGVALVLVGIGQVIGVATILDLLEKEGLGCFVSFWQSGGVLTIGTLVVILGFIAEVIYDAGHNSATKEDED